MLVFNVTATPTRHRQQHAGVQRHCNTHTSPTAACWCSTSLQHPHVTDSSMLVFNVTATPTRHRQQHAGVQRHCNTHTSPTAACWCSTSLQHPHVTDSSMLVFNVTATPTRHRQRKTLGFDAETVAMPTVHSECYYYHYYVNTTTTEMQLHYKGNHRLSALVNYI